MGVQFCVVGALVPELLLDTKPSQATNDADIVIAVEDLNEYARVKDGLNAYGFEPTRISHRLRYRDGGLVDILPYGDTLVRHGKLTLERGREMTMAGFEHAIGASIRVEIEPSLTLPVIPLPLYAVLKLVAYGDRKAEKDLVSLDHLFRNYSESDSRRWGLEFAGDLVSDDFASAHLLGLDGREYLGDSVIATISPLLDRLSAQEDEAPEEDWRPRRSTLFLWFRRGLGI